MTEFLAWFWLLMLPVLLLGNYSAARWLGPILSRALLAACIFPPLALIAYAGWQLGYAIVNADEVNRNFRQGDLTHFGADLGFFAALTIGFFWISFASFGNALGAIAAHSTDPRPSAKMLSYRDCLVP